MIFPCGMNKTVLLVMPTLYRSKNMREVSILWSISCSVIMCDAFSFSYLEVVFFPPPNVKLRISKCLVMFTYLNRSGLKMSKQSYHWFKVKTWHISMSNFYYWQNTIRLSKIKTTMNKLRVCTIMRGQQWFTDVCRIMLYVMSRNMATVGLLLVFILWKCCPPLQINTNTSYFYQHITAGLILDKSILIMFSASRRRS